MTAETPNARTGSQDATDTPAPPGDRISDDDFDRALGEAEPAPEPASEPASDDVEDPSNNEDLRDVPLDTTDAHGAG